MKLKSLAIAIALAATSASTFAADKEEGFYIGAFGDYYDASWENIRAQAGLDINESTGWGAEVGYRFSDYWSARIEYADMDFNAFDKVNGNRNNVDGERYGIDGLYHFNGGPFYGLFGIKEIDVVKDNTFLNVGVGYQHFITDGLFVNAETAVYQGLDKGYTDLGAKIGINYLFGQNSAPAEPVKPAPEPVVVEAPVATPADSDNDGVVNADDKCANTPMTDAVDSDGCTLYEEAKVTTSLLVTFPHDSAMVKQQYFDDIAAVSKFLKEHTETTVLLEGHASAVGDASYNKKLSKKRADDVADELVKDGISRDRISTVGYGEERLKNTANTKAAHAENRRVEAHVSTVERVKVKR
ncbi:MULTISPECIES: OmpA family protein [Pseudoalteromonas]|jgi:OOP family OmpA-OmpF porin|uniref:OmpA-OmpF porin, OOP family n=1 Tax=Pseudoalteromonas aliena SW19 TaxID=1314866 RepID=A0ABR9DWN7_9GAMM|nr:MULTISPECIES: OmpA family protein [Pseudoalteromonas]MBE0358553.1 OmpA-OmpF porin, OOP family [Pseudoalteromonas aliena SW19]